MFLDKEDAMSEQLFFRVEDDDLDDEEDYLIVDNDY